MCTRQMFALLASLVSLGACPLTATAAPGDAASTNGLTVTGRGVASSPADALAFDVRLGSRRAAPGATPAPGPQSLGELEAAPRSLAASLTGAGAKQVSITFDSSLNGYTTYPFDVHGILERPSHDRILSLILSGALATLPDGSSIPIQSAAGYLVLNDCAALDARADVAAFDDAKRRALALAGYAHLRLGAVRSISTPGEFLTCPTYRPTVSGGFGGPPLGNGLPLDGPYVISVERNVTVTFAIAP